MKYLIPILLLLIGCVNTEGVISDESTEGIMNGSESMYMSTELNPEQAFAVIQKTLLREGYRLGKANKEVGNITTQGHDLGQSTLVRLNIFIEKSSTGSQIIARAEWRPGTGANAMATAMTGIEVNSEWEQAKWSDGRPQRAFASMVNTLKKISHTSVSYGI